MDFTATPRHLAQFFGALTVCLIVAHVVVQAARFATGNDSLFGLVALFSLGADGNLPTFYSSFAILFCAMLLTWIGVAGWGDRHIHTAYWLGLAVIFLFLSADEMLALHEHLVEPVRSTLHTGGLFYYAWVIPYGAALLIFLAVYFRFLLRLPVRTAVLFVVAGATYVGGAAGVEMISGWYSEVHGNSNLIYVVLQTIEETLEMVGIVVFIFALADYIDRRFGVLTVRISSGSGPVGSGLEQ